MYKQNIKTLLFYLLFCIVIGGTGCSSHKLSHKELTLNAGDTITITANAQVTWSSSNDFVATVNADGKVTANHVGETDILAVVDNNSVPCHVSVLAKYEKEFQEPIHDFKLNKEDIKAMSKGTVKKENNEMLLYYMDEKGYEEVLFFFDNESGKVKSVLFSFEFPFMMEKYAKYLAERYQLIQIDSNSKSLYFADALSLEEAKLVVILTLRDNKVLISYQKNTKNEK
ncbi:MAG: Ig-like domain-containing protein [Bacteroidales bacterium]|nr:Ig-like domain-containing protein [Bacteroidales bacterium]